MSNHTCQICKLSLKTRGLSSHLKYTHNIDSKEYYDKFFRKEDDGKCLTCSNETRYYGFNRGYASHCSQICNNNDDIVTSKKRETQLQTYKDNPHIVNNRKVKLIEWYKNNPDKIKEASEKRKQWNRDNIEEVIATNKRTGPQRSKTQSITNRKKFAELTKSDSTIPHFLYIVQHLEKPIIKIGRSEDPHYRLRKIIEHFGPSEIVHILEGPYNEIQPLETHLHDYFNDHCMVQPSGAGRTEWFDNIILSEAISKIVIMQYQ